MKAHQTFYSSPFEQQRRSNARNAHYESHSNLKRNNRFEYDSPESFMTERELRHFKRCSTLRTQEIIIPYTTPNIDINPISKQISTTTSSSVIENPLSMQKISQIQTTAETQRYNFRNARTDTSCQCEDNQFITSSNRRDMSIEQIGPADMGTYQISYSNQVKSDIYNNNKQNTNPSMLDDSQNDQSQPDTMHMNLNHYTSCTQNQRKEFPQQSDQLKIEQSLQTPMNNNNNNNQMKRTKRNWMELVDSSNIIQNPSSKKRLTRRLMQLPISPTSENNVNETLRQLNVIVNRSRKRRLPLKQPKIQQCTICLGSPENDVYGRIACTHQFCLECILQWSSITNQCPMCRKDFLAIHVHSSSDSSEAKRRCNRSVEQHIIPVEPKKQRIPDEDEFYWEDVSDDEAEDEICYICETDYDEEKLLICDKCEVRICHSYCDNELFDDSIPRGEWYCHECRLFTD